MTRAEPFPALDKFFLSVVFTRLTSIRHRCPHRCRPL